MDQTTTTAADPEVPTVAPDTLAFIYDYVKGIPEEQAKDIDALSTKMVQIFTAAGVIMGLAGLTRLDGQAPAVANVFLIGALAGYLGVAGAALYHLWTRLFHRPIAPDNLWQLSWQDTPEEIRRSLIAQVGRVYHKNRQLLELKDQSIRWALIAATFEVICFSLSVVALRFSS